MRTETKYLILCREKEPETCCKMKDRMQNIFNMDGRIITH